MAVKFWFFLTWKQIETFSEVPGYISSEQNKEKCQQCKKYPLFLLTIIWKSLLMFVILQGVPQWNGQSNLPLTDRNMQVGFAFKVALRSWIGEFYENER